MNYILLKCSKEDYMIVSEEEWKDFNKRKDSIARKDQKDRMYKLGDRFFSIKETRKIKNIFAGTYLDMYKLLPDIVLKYGDYRRITDSILKFLENAPERRWDFINYFACDFTKDTFKVTEYDYNYEAFAKYNYLMLFSSENIKDLTRDQYTQLVEVCMKSRNNNNPVIKEVLSDKRFELPKDFDIFYSDEMEFDEHLCYIKDKAVISDFFINNRKGLHRFLMHPNVYTPEIVSVLVDINPVIYTIDGEINKYHFTELYRKRKGMSTMGSLDAASASNSIILKFARASDLVLKEDFEEVYKDKEIIEDAYNDYVNTATLIIDGINNVPEIFSRKTAKKLLDCFGSVLKCESRRDEMASLLNKAISAFDCGKYAEDVLDDIFSDWVEDFSIDFKKNVRYIDDRNKAFICRYLSEAEIRVIEDNQ